MAAADIDTSVGGQITNDASNGDIREMMPERTASSAPTNVESPSSGSGSVRDEVKQDEDIEVIVEPPLPNERPKDVITLSSDSESCDDDKPGTSASAKHHKQGNTNQKRGSSQDDDKDSLEIIQELPYSYMNRPRGPKPAFLRSLLQQTNREIEQGRKISDNTYQSMPPGSSFATTATLKSTPNNVQEVFTLSSDEEEDLAEMGMEKQNDTSSPAVTKDELHTKSLEIMEPNKLSVDDGDGHAAGSSGSGASGDYTNGNATNRKRSHPSNDSTKETAVVVGDAPTTPKQSTSSKSRIRDRPDKRTDPENRIKFKKTEARGRMVEKLLASRMKELKEIGEEEVDCDDEKNSAFLRRQKLSKTCNNVFKILCKTKGLSIKTGRRVEYQIKLSNNLIEFPEIVKAVQNFANSLRRNFPAYFQVEEVVAEAAAQHYPAINSQNVQSIAKILFEEVKKKMRERRETDSIEDGYAVDLSPVLLGQDPSDPALESPELAARLKDNDRLRDERDKELEKKEQELQQLWSREALEEDSIPVPDESDEENSHDEDEVTDASDVDEGHEGCQPVNGDSSSAPPE